MEPENLLVFALFSENPDAPIARQRDLRNLDHKAT